MSESNENFAAEVWNKLSAINVNEHTEKKGGFTYLSWVWAWGTLMKHYPESTYKWLEPRYEADQSMTVGVKVTIRQGENKLSRKMLLPVLNFKNNAIENPNAMDINSARMRCLAKAISMFGLGSYLYAGEDLPEAERNVKPKEPRVPHDKHLKTVIAKMKTCDSLPALQIQFTGAFKHFKEWRAPEAIIEELVKAKDENKRRIEDIIPDAPQQEAVNQ